MKVTSLTELLWMWRLLLPPLVTLVSRRLRTWLKQMLEALRCRRLIRCAHWQQQQQWLQQCLPAAVPGLAVAAAERRWQHPQMSPPVDVHGQT